MNELAFDYSGYLLIVIAQPPASQIEMITEVLHHCWTHHYVNVNVLVSSPHHQDVEMYTYFPYAPLHCEEVVPALINRYFNGTFVHTVDFANKFKNMHGCRLYFAPLEFMPYVIYQRYTNGTVSVHGIEYSVLAEIAKRLNFTIEIQIIPPQSTYIKSIEIAFKMVSIRFYSCHAQSSQARRPAVHQRANRLTSDGCLHMDTEIYGGTSTKFGEISLKFGENFVKYLPNFREIPPNFHEIFAKFSLNFIDFFQTRA